MPAVDTWGCVHYMFRTQNVPPIWIEPDLRRERLMALRDYIKQLKARGELVKVTGPVSRTYEAAGVLKKLEPKPVLFERVRESDFRVIGNLFCTKAAFADYFRIQISEIIPTLAAAISNRAPYEIVQTAPCQEVIHTDPHLHTLPNE